LCYNRVIMTIFSFLLQVARYEEFYFPAWRSFVTEPWGGSMNWLVIVAWILLALILALILAPVIRRFLEFLTILLLIHSYTKFLPTQNNRQRLAALQLFHRQVLKAFSQPQKPPKNPEKVE
jgi:hypothetical protein